MYYFRRIAELVFLFAGAGAAVYYYMDFLERHL
jgi:hypothetical protein